jgi:large subunit ribosomal protein L21
MTYAIISVGGKQYRVREGERLLVDRLALDADKTFKPDVLLVGGNGDPDLSPKAGVVTARVVEHVLGDKIRIGKYRRRTGYRRHFGYRSRLSAIQIESIGAAKRSKRAKKEAADGDEKEKAASKRRASTRKKKDEE